MNPEIQKECESRMRFLGLSDTIIEDFKKGNLYMSQNGVARPITQEETELINKYFWEPNSGNYIIFHAIRGFDSMLGDEMISLLMTHTNDEYWDDENKLMKWGYAASFVVNLSFPEYSEFGTIHIKPAPKGVLRYF